MDKDCGDLISELPAEVQAELKKRFGGDTSSSVYEVGKSLDYLFQSKMKETSEEYFSFSKGLQIIGRLIDAEKLDANGKVLNQTHIDDILDNLTGETSGSIAAVKNDFTANRADVHKNGMYRELYAIKDDPELSPDFEKFMSEKGNPAQEKQMWVYMETGRKQGKPTGAYKDIAEAIMSIQKKNLAKKQILAGHQNMGEIKNYGVSHANDAQAILPNRQKWEEGLDGLDWFKSFGISHGDEAGKTSIKQKWYRNMETGNTSSPVGLTEGKRSLVFKTKELEYEYYRDFGLGDKLADKVKADINQVSNQIALGEKFGPKVETTLDMVFDFFDTQYPGELSNFRKDTIRTSVRAQAGSLQKPSYQNNKVARTNRAFKNGVRTAMLNKAALSGVNDITAISVKGNSDSGGNIWGNFVSATTNSIESFAKHHDPEYVKMFKDKLGIVLDIERGDIIHKYAGDDAGSLKPKNTNWIEDTLAWSSKMSMKVFGAERLGNSIKEAGVTQASDTMEKILRNTGELNFNEKLLLEESGIKDGHLKIIRKHIKNKDGQPEVNIAQMENVIARMEPGSERMILQDAADRMETFLMSRYNTSSATGTLKSRTQVRGIHTQGEMDKEIISLVGTFKAPLIDNLRIINENFKIRGMEGNRAQSQALLVAYVLAQGTMMGMGIEWLRTGITTGFGLSEDDKKTERWDDMMERFGDAANFDLKAIGAIGFESIMSSGVMGVAGDYVGGGFAFEGSRMVDRLAGPSLGLIGKGADAVVGDLTNFDPNNIKTLKQLGKSMPFQNAPIVDPFVAYYLKELLRQR